MRDQVVVTLAGTEGSIIDQLSAIGTGAAVHLCQRALRLVDPGLFGFCSHCAGTVSRAAARIGDPIHTMAVAEQRADCHRLVQMGPANPTCPERGARSGAHQNGEGSVDRIDPGR